MKKYDATLPDESATQPVDSNDSVSKHTALPKASHEHEYMNVMNASRIYVLKRSESLALSAAKTFGIWQG